MNSYNIQLAVCFLLTMTVQVLGQQNLKRIEPNDSGPILDGYKLVSVLQVENELVSSLAFSRDGSILAAGDYAGNIFRWTTNNWHQLKPIRSESPEPYVQNLNLSNDSRTIAATAPYNNDENPNRLLVWNADSRSTLCKLSGYPNSSRRLNWRDCMYLPDSSKLLAIAETAIGKGKHTLFEVDITECSANRLLPNGEGDARCLVRAGPQRVAFLSILPDDSQVNASYSLHLVDYQRGKDSGSVKWGNSRIISMPSDFNRFCLAISTDGAFAAIGGIDRTKNSDPFGVVECWDIKKSKRLYRMVDHPGEVNRVGFLDNGQTMIAIGGAQYGLPSQGVEPVPLGTITLRNTKSGKSICRIRSEHPFETLAICSTTQTIAIGAGHYSEKPKIYVWSKDVTPTKK